MKNEQFSINCFPKSSENIRDTHFLPPDDGEYGKRSMKGIIGVLGVGVVTVSDALLILSLLNFVAIRLVTNRSYFSAKNENTMRTRKR